MKFSEQWLREWVNADLDHEHLLAQLTMAGLEVDSVEAAAGDFNGIIVAEVLNVEQHPNADKLRICTVNANQEQTLSIVCGAANVRAGLKVALAMIGAVMPGGLKIKRSKLRGVESFGMICSESELGLAESAQGIYELADDAPVGQCIREYLALDDNIIDVDLTPNRGDCLSITGISREVALFSRAELQGVAITDIPAQHQETFPVTIDDKAGCPRYVGRLIKAINPKATTPLWMTERLRRSGLRSIAPVVDVTNYVMLELGQPMHAFDADKLTGQITVRKARNGEQLTLLNDAEVTLKDNTLLITDDQGPLAIAGIMGGAASGVGDDSRDIFLESAFFDPIQLAGKARSYGLSTDSSHRFERGVDAQLQKQAIERATQLLLDIVGGQAGPVVDLQHDEYMPQPKQITLRHQRIHRLLGISFEAEEVQDILQRLGMVVSSHADGWLVNVPPHRFDVSLEEDLIEELARVRGYNNIPNNLPKLELAMFQQSEQVLPLNRLRSMLVERGYHETITYSFVDPKIQQLVAPNIEALELLNPISSDLSVMRTSLLPGLLTAYLHNSHRQLDRVRLFESGLVFINQKQQLLQQNVIAGLISHNRYPEQWDLPVQHVDFYDIKGDVEALLQYRDRNDGIQFKETANPALHPGQSAQIEVNGQVIGFVGMIHPGIAQSLHITDNLFAFELNLNEIQQKKLPSYEFLSKFPSIRRDLAILVDKGISAEQITQAVNQAADSLVTNTQIFDVYTGDGVDFEQKSVALALTLQHPERTLVDEEVNISVNKIIESLASNLNATLRN